VAAAGGGASRESAEALAQLCDAYWRPLYAYVRRTGHDAEEARDLTQEFFTRLIEKRYVRSADPERGRFRTYLLAALKHFLANEWDRSRAAKRGGGVPTIPLDWDTAEHSYGLETADPVTPEKIFERRWALTVLGRAMARLRSEFEGNGRAGLFDAIQPLLTDENRAGSYSQTAPELKMTSGALKVAVHRARRRFALLVRDEVAATLDRSDEIEDELHHLLASL